MCQYIDSGYATIKTIPLSGNALPGRRGCCGRKSMIIVIAANRAAPDIGGMKEPTEPVDEPENQHESTYGLLIRSEEKSRNVLEMLIYPLLIIGAIVAIWQFVLQAMELPSMNGKGGSAFQEKRLTALA